MHDGSLGCLREESDLAELSKRNFFFTSRKDPSRLRVAPPASVSCSPWICLALRPCGDRRIDECRAIRALNEGCEGRVAGCVDDTKGILSESRP